jgi:poly-gamma-glutamate synthesis protein (capsule biosynthesis protein)
VIGMTLQLALAGDTMLGRGVAERLRVDARHRFLDRAIAEIALGAELFLVNLECCLSERGAPIDVPGKPFFFRAPPIAAQRLAEIGVDAVSLANNHVLDYGTDALTDTLRHLLEAGIATVGAGVEVSAARAPAALTRRAHRVRIVGATDHPAGYAATPTRPGTAYADLRRSMPAWLSDAARPHDGELVVVSVHWGPNMTESPVPHVRAAAALLQSAGATLVAGHSAHVPHGVQGRVLFDLGDFVDDYARDGNLRNDLSLLWLVTLGPAGPVRVEGVPLHLDYAYTRAADPGETRALLALMVRRCAAVGSHVELVDGRLLFEPSDA